MTSTVPTPTTPDQPTEPIKTTGAELAVGDWIASCCGFDEPGEVLSVHPYTDDEGTFVMAVFRTVSSDTPLIDHLDADQRVALASKADVDAAKDSAFRRGVVRDVHSFANLLADLKTLPMTRSVDLDVQVASLDELTTVSQALDIDMEADSAGRHSVRWPKGRKSYERGVHVEWFLYVEKEPKSAPVAEAVSKDAPATAGTGLDFSREPDAPTATPVPKGVDGRPVGKRTPAKAGRP